MSILTAENITAQKPRSKGARFFVIILLLVAAMVMGWVIEGGNKVREAVAFVRGMDEYVYGFPLVMMDVTKDVLTATPTSGEYGAPMNQFARIREYVNPDFKNVVRISVNSLWSDGFLDLDAEPMIVSVPDMDTYIVAQAMNMWTDNFMSVGTRTNGGKAGNYLIAGPKWNGTAPKDVNATFHCSTRYAWVLVQMSAASPADFPAIHAKQDLLKITPLSAWGTNYTPPTNVPVNPNVDLTATPFDQVKLMTGANFFARLARILHEDPPYPADAGMVERLKKLGVEAGKPFEPTKLDPAVLAGINKVPAVVWEQFWVGPYNMKTVNGWINMVDIGAYGTDYQTRAFLAYAGLGALSKEDALYPSAFVDADGIALDGSNNYVMHFEKDGLPPSNVGVWSISQYRENFYVKNELDRYGILSSMPLKYNANGSLDIYFQPKSPGADKESNWLPNPPSGSFNVSVRVYQPKQSIVDGNYKLPSINRIK